MEQVVRVVRWVRDHGFVLGPIAIIAVCFLLVFAVFTVGRGLARDSALFCGSTNKSGTTVDLPAEPITVAELESMLKKRNSCASLAIELTVTGDHPANTVLEPIGQSVTFVNKDPIAVLIEASVEDFLLECRDTTGRRADNFPEWPFDERKSCDPTIETRCRSGYSSLGLCPEIGNDGQRCLNEHGHIVLRCGPSAQVCLDEAGHFVACDG